MPRKKPRKKRPNPAAGQAPPDFEPFKPFTDALKDPHFIADTINIFLNGFLGRRAPQPRVEGPPVVLTAADIDTIKEIIGTGRAQLARRYHPDRPEATAADAERLIRVNQLADMLQIDFDRMREQIVRGAQAHR